MRSFDDLANKLTELEKRIEIIEDTNIKLSSDKLTALLEEFGFLTPRIRAIEEFLTSGFDSYSKYDKRKFK